MDNTTFLALALVYIASGTVILQCFYKMKMRIAFVCFAVLFVVFALYIPAVLGTGMMEKILLPLTGMPTNKVVQSFFLSCAPYFTVTSVVTVVFALIVGIAALVLSIHVVYCVVRLFKNELHKLQFVRPQKYSRKITATANQPKRIYIEFCRLLN